MTAFEATYATTEDFQVAFTAEISRGGLLVRGATLSGAQPGAQVALTVTVAGKPAQISARVAAVVPGVGVAVMFDGVPAELAAFNEPQPSGEKDLPVAGPPGPLSERLKKMTVNEKMQLALSGSRDERAAIFRDTNKTLHIFVLKNPRIGLDEVQAAAKLPQLSPDAIKLVSEHREWGTNPTVCSSLVRNPKTPMPIALRLLERVPVADLKAIAKGGARDALVHAARKKISG